MSSFPKAAYEVSRIAPKSYVTVYPEDGEADRVEGMSKRKKLEKFVVDAVGKGRHKGVMKRLRVLGVEEIDDLKWLEPSDFVVGYIDDADRVAFLNAVSFLTTPSHVGISPSGQVSLYSTSPRSTQYSASSSSSSKASPSPVSSCMAWNGEFPISLRSAKSFQTTH
eukprot:TRINITY_DN9607_c0_g1_i1.p1 TRINITY_DN9607_c0_g1~~TRINITY_DN9607_c0_g1_i1.p1  ORF type:complete len:166 (+),score=30.50 TRINITY_DN9607_c0_g1_i1:989-1486(+)